MINPTDKDIGRKVFFKKLILADTIQDDDRLFVEKFVYRKEHGVISSVKEKWVFVKFENLERYPKDTAPELAWQVLAACKREDLEWVQEKEIAST